MSHQKTMPRLYCFTVIGTDDIAPRVKYDVYCFVKWIFLLTVGNVTISSTSVEFRQLVYFTKLTEFMLLNSKANTSTRQALSYTRIIIFLEGFSLNLSISKQFATCT